jgi:hypothetical protein
MQLQPYLPRNSRHFSALVLQLLFFQKGSLATDLLVTFVTVSTVESRIKIYLGDTY